MMETNHTDTAGPTGVERVFVRERLRHVSWGAILLGLIVAIAVQILLGLLGLGLGFTMVDPSDPMAGIGAWGIATSVYVVAVQVLSLLGGGYIAARLAPARTDQSAMFHGLSIWALATIIMVWVGSTTAGHFMSGLSSAVSAAGSATAQAVQTIIPEDISLPDVGFQDLPEPVRATLRESGITAENFRRELRGAYRDVVSRQQEQRLVQRLQQAAGSILQKPTAAPETIDRAMDDVFGRDGIFSQDDLDEMQSSLQRRLNLSDEAVEQITSQVGRAVEQAREGIKEGVKAAQQQAIEAAEATSDTIASIALWLFFANLLALVAAVIGGRVGEVKDTA